MNGVFGKNEIRSRVISKENGGQPLLKSYVSIASSLQIRFRPPVSL